MGREKYGEGKERLVIQGWPHHVSNIVEAVLWYGHVWLPLVFTGVFWAWHQKLLMMITIGFILYMLPVIVGVVFSWQNQCVAVSLWRDKTLTSLYDGCLSMGEERISLSRNWPVVRGRLMERKKWCVRANVPACVCPLLWEHACVCTCTSQASSLSRELLFIWEGYF